MTSFKSKIFVGLMRNRHLLKGKLKKETFKDSVDAVLKFRDECEKGAERFGKLPESVSVKKETLSNIYSEWLIPENSPKEKLIFYVHGGGYVSGSCNDHRNIVAKIVLNAGLTNLLYEYKLAPEHPYPAALNDSISVYKSVLAKGYKPENIIIMGESAGGGLALALLLALKKKGISLPKAVVAISPWVDLSCSNAVYHKKNKLSLAPYESWNVFSKYYCGTTDKKEPFISPLYGDLKGLPPIYINAGNCDELFADGKLFYEKAKATGVNIHFEEGDKMIHCYPLLSPYFPEATDAMNKIVEFIHFHLK